MSGIKKLKRAVCLALYYGVARYLPHSYVKLGIGAVSKNIRVLLCRGIFKKCGKNVNSERGAYFAGGAEVELGDNSGLGSYCDIPYNTKIGDYVMMGPNCKIFSANHRFDRTDIPMGLQGSGEKLITVIGSDAWIGQNVMILPSRHVSDGSILAAGCILTKDFPPYSVIGGNPGKVLKSRK